MSIRMKIAFGCYLLNCLAAMGVGVTYMSSSQIMPYHQQVIGGKWEDLAPGVQTLLLIFFHGNGGALFFLGLLGLILLFIPFRRGEVWSRWALAVFFVPVQIGNLNTAVHLHLTTHASTPWRFVAVMTVLVLVAALLSIERRR